MLPSLITVTAVVVLVSVDPSSASWGSPALGSLVQAYGVFRHGPRTPLYEEYPLFLRLRAHDEKFTVLRGGLTQFGMNKMYEAGKWMAMRYNGFLGNVYKEENVWVSARGASRAVMTALSIMAGMFPPNPLIFDDLKWQPIPIWGIYEDKSYMFHDFEFKKMDLCPRYKLLADRLTQSVLEKDETLKPLYSKLRTLTGNQNIRSIMSVFKIYDQLHSEFTNEVPLPGWALAKNPDLGDKIIYPDLLSETIDVWKRSTIADELMKLHIGPMFRNINDQFLKKSQNPKEGSKLIFHVSEDTTLYGIIRTLGINYLDLYEPGSALLIELHFENLRYNVRFYHYNIMNHEVLEVEATNCRETPCSLQTFQVKFPGLTLAQWEDGCRF